MAFNETGTTPTISVLGVATVRAEPDEALLTVSLTALDASPGAALEDVANRGRDLLALLEALAISEADHSTTGVSVREEFDHTPEGRRSNGHRAISSTLVRLVDLDVVGRLITRATTELGAHIDGPRWQIAAENPVRLQAAREAASDGERRARAYAEGVGAQLGPLLKLVEPDTGGRPMFRAMAASGRGEMPVEPGEQEVTAAIEVSFALVLDRPRSS